jgi:hypothetical protein
MPSLTFEGDSHDEIVQSVRRWLESVDHGPSTGEVVRLSPAEAVERGAELTKDALRVIAAAAPAPMAANEVVRNLTEMGYKATDQTRDAVIAGLESLERVTGGGVVQRAEEATSTVVQRAEDATANVMWQMSAAVAKQLLKSLRTPPR